MILECIVTTVGPNGEVNIAPMGPVVDEADVELNRFTLKPYQTATTFANLKRSGCGVLHVCDNVELLARAAISQWESLPPTEQADRIEGRVLSEANRWYEFEVETLDDSADRATIVCRTVHRGRRQDLVGLNRAKFAVLEAAILMTRLEFIPHGEIKRQLTNLRTVVDKTAGRSEARAFELLVDFFQKSTSGSEASENHDG